MKVNEQIPDADLRQALETEREINRQLKSDLVILSLLHCAKRNLDRILEALEDSGYNIHAGKILVLELLLLPQSDPALIPTLDEVLELHRGARQFMDAAIGKDYCLMHTHEADAYYCIISGDVDHPLVLEKLKHTAEVLVETLGKTYFIETRANLSDVIPEFSAMEQAMKMLDQLGSYRRFLMEDDLCLSYHEIAYRITDRNGGEAPEKKMIYEIRTHQYQEALVRLDEFLRYLFVENRPGAENLESQFYRLVNPLLDTIEEVRSDVRMSEENRQELDQCRQSLLGVSNLSGLHDAAVRTIRLLETLYNSSSEAEEPKWMGRLEQLIQEQYGNSQIGVNVLADELGLSSVHMSRVFRQCRKQGIMDYIHILRIQRARELLALGESVKKVSEEVGYSTPLSMNRAFKKYDGQTPGAYNPRYTGLRSVQ